MFTGYKITHLKKMTFEFFNTYKIFLFYNTSSMCVYVFAYE